MRVYEVRPALMKYWAALGKRNVHLSKQAIRSDAAIIHEAGRLSIAQGELDNFSSSDTLSPPTSLSMMAAQTLMASQSR